MNIQKPNAAAPQSTVKTPTQTPTQAKSSAAAGQAHKTHHFQAYMSADGRPKEAFHPYRNMSQPAQPPSSALLAKRGIVRPLAMASLPMDPTKKR